MQQEQRQARGARPGVRQRGDDMERNGVEKQMGSSVDVDVEVGQRVRTWLDREHLVARDLSVVGVMIGGIVRPFLGMGGEHPLYRQLTDMAEERQGNEDENE